MQKRTTIISIMARDRVGIVADVTEVIRQLNGNLADLSQTVLRGYFTMIVVATFPANVATEKIRAALLALDEEEPFEVGIKTTNAQLATEPEKYENDRYVLTAVGQDKIGLVAAVAEFLRDRQINIVDLTTKAADGLYTMILMLDLPAEMDVQKLKLAAMQKLKQVGINIQLQHYNIFRATNEV
jgi:glycine cleavage system transcriptional repressor